MTLNLNLLQFILKRANNNSKKYFFHYVIYFMHQNRKCALADKILDKILSASAEDAKRC